jgi:hypothetical protein
VRHLPRQAHLLVETRECRRVLRERGGQKLERDRLLEFQVVGAVDLAHAPAAQQPDDAVAPGQLVAGDEARALD